MSQPQSPRPAWLLLLIVATLCAGCAQDRSEAHVNACALLPLRDYDRAAQAAVAEEIEAADEGAMWPSWIEDYGTLRAAVWACQNATARHGRGARGG